MAYEILIVIGLLLAGGWLLVSRYQQKVQRLRNTGVFPQPGQETEADVDRLLQMGQKIEAIKVFRALHGVGLQEAKDAVDSKRSISDDADRRHLLQGGFALSGHTASRRRPRLEKNGFRAP